MRRTQIYLDNEIYKYLERESKIEHKSISEIIRDSIKCKMQDKKDNLLKNMEAVFGLWKDRDFDVDAHIRNLRKDRKIW